MQQERKIKTFENELALIPCKEYQMFLEDCLCLVPDYFFEISASYSNWHHPYWALGSGGTVRHTKAVTKTVYDLSGTMIEKNNKERLSAVIVAAVLHDSFKYGFSFDLRLYDLHPYIPRVALGKVITGQLEEEQKDWIFKAIESHMGPYYNGKWAPLHYVTYENFRKDPLALLVHQADYLVSRLDYVFDEFREVNKGVGTEDLPSYEPFPDHMIKGMVLGLMSEHLADEEVASYLNDGTVGNIVNRAAALREPRHRQKYQYNYDSLLKNIKDNLGKFIPLFKDVDLNERD